MNWIGIDPSSRRAQSLYVTRGSHDERRAKCGDGMDADSTPLVTVQVADRLDEAVELRLDGRESTIVLVQDLRPLGRPGLLGLRGSPCRPATTARLCRSPSSRGRGRRRRGTLALVRGR